MPSQGGGTMFGIGPLEMVVILALALIVLGPQKFPEAGRAVGKALREFRSMTSDLSRDINFDLDAPPPRRVPSHTVEVSEPDSSEKAAPASEPVPSIEKAEAKQPEENQPGPL